MSIFSKQKLKEQIEEHRKAEIAKGLKLIGKQRMHKGHTLWEYNAVTFELNKAVIEEKLIYSGGSAKVKKNVTIKKDCQYFSCLNRKNAVDKLEKVGLIIK